MVPSVFLVSVTAITMPFLGVECNCVPVTPGLSVGVGLVTGTASGGSSIDPPSRWRRSSANALSTAAGTAVGVVSSIESWVDGDCWHDAVGVSVRMSGPGVSAHGSMSVEGLRSVFVFTVSAGSGVSSSGGPASTEYCLVNLSSLSWASWYWMWVVVPAA